MNMLSLHDIVLRYRSLAQMQYYFSAKITFCLLDVILLCLRFFLVLNQSMSVKIIFIYSNENDGFHIKIIMFWSEKLVERSRHQLALEFPKGFSKTQPSRKRLLVGRITRIQKMIKELWIYKCNPVDPFLYH